MTVKELIEKLQEMPQDLLVVDYGWSEIEDVRLEHECYMGDPANPACPVIEAVVVY